MSSAQEEPLSSAIALGLSQTPIAPIAPVARRGTGAAAPPQAPWRRALVIADPEAGHGRGRSVADELRRGLATLGVAVDVHALRGPGDARARLATIPADTDLIVCAGDADTFADVLSGWPGGDVAIACLPMVGQSDRSVGRLRKELGLARDVDGALEMLARRQAVAFPFLRVGRDAALASLAVAAPRGCGPLSIAIDGEARADPLRRVRLRRRSSPWRRREPTFDFELETVTRRTRGLARLFGRREPIAASHIAIDAPEPVPVVVDGRALGTTPVELDVETSSRLLVP